MNVGNLDTKSINNFLIQTLYSKENLNNHLSVGFRGNPNVGTVVLQEMLEGASWYNAFKTHCGEEDRVFIISSILVVLEHQAIRFWKEKLEILLIPKQCLMYLWVL